MYRAKFTALALFLCVFFIL